MNANFDTLTKERRTALRRQLLELVGKRPLQPFRIHLNDGRSFDVRYPNMTLVMSTLIEIGIPEPTEPDPYVDHSVDVDLGAISKIEMLPSAQHSRQFE